MPDGFSAAVNTVEYEGAMQRLRAGVRAGFVDPSFGTLSVQGRLLAQRCSDFTPPRNKAQGQAAVARDLTRIFAPIEERTFTNKGLRKIIRSDDRGAWDKVAQRFSDSHRLRNTRAMAFSPEWHVKNRISRGRARTGKKGNLGFVTLGPQAVQARGYLKDVQRRVGWAKAGWNAGLIGLGGTPKGDWIARHGKKRGALVDGRSADDPFVQVINDTGWARYGSMGEGERILANAIRARARDMESYYFRMMKLAGQKSGALSS